jgi:hypothetical protein
MAYETGKAAVAKKWTASAYIEGDELRAFIEAFPTLHFYRGGADDDLQARAEVTLPSWYRAQRRCLIGPYIDEPGAVWDARLRFSRADFEILPHAESFSAAGERDWFVLTNFGYADADQRRHLLGACGLLPIGVRFGYHLHLAISIKKPTDKHIYAVHLDEVGAAVAAGKIHQPHAAFKSYASMLQSVAEVKKGNDGPIIARK